jgi:hypothetical protein
MSSPESFSELKTGLSFIFVCALHLLVFRIRACKLTLDDGMFTSNNGTYVLKVGMCRTKVIPYTTQWDLIVVDATTQVSNAYAIGNNCR